ncbi:gluconate 5-dehydrogenase [Actinoplanes tereljensis]|uniref:Gluconate 5-dehydrogenase n=1 Tax=Paractinoplanes tereljensis TaxID=571912 RepID=A0A919TZ50_9ACTN|nr:SDR family oxidoreductase [Actinoplanes tereljensis]GIF25537.1 gluconate 5-dehydrogenase [Actinoplanes tereljensis]
MSDLAGRRVVITGAGRGIGRVLAAAFDAAGAQLALVARGETALKEVAEGLHGDPLICPGDVRDAAFNDGVAADMVERFGGVDVWICNAGVSPEFADATETSPETWREIVDTNLTGAFLGARAGAAVMGAGGRIIVTGSVLGHRPRGGLAAYSASKSGAHSLVAAMAQELGPRGITVNAVALGWFETGVGTHWRRDAERSTAIAEHTALGRWGTPDDLPGVFLFLASAGSAYVTGATLTVDGGYSLL